MSDNRDERLSLAVDAYKNSPLSLADLSAYYNIPISTIRRHANGINQSTKPGPKTVLSEATEILIKKLIIYMCDIGFSLDKDGVLDVVENYCIRTGQDIFKKQRPSSEWFELYMKRHPDLSKRIANNMQSHRAVAMNKEHILFWFNKLKEVFDEHDLYNHPDRLWNCDESGLQCNGGRCQIICRKGCKNPKLITSANEKKHWTILSCCNANGVYLPHNIIYQGKNLYSNWMLHGREDFVYNTSESGWMETEQFLNWFKQVFLKHVNKQPGYKVLFLDGHSSHISLELIDCARQNNVILLKEKETKRIERERKKEMRLATQAEKAEKKPKKTRNSKRKIDEVEPESETQEQDSQTKAFGFGRFCYVCNEEFGPNSDSVKWWPCEGRNCSNWCCGCESDLDYTCKYCKKL